MIRLTPHPTIHYFGNGFHPFRLAKQKSKTGCFNGVAVWRRQEGGFFAVGRQTI
jgi:hypothetical protein